MKKALILLCVALISLCASAQEGQMAAGINIGVAPVLKSGANTTNFGMGLKYQYNLTDPIRVEADIEYWFKAKGSHVFDVFANIHYLFDIQDNLRVYPLAGIGFAHIGFNYSSSTYYDGGDEDYDFGDDYEGDWGWGAPRRVAASNSADDYVTNVEYSSSITRFMFNIGVGCEYDLTSNIAVCAELKYQFMKDWSRLPITVGVTYKF